jgi:hypothetical protein
MKRAYLTIFFLFTLFYSTAQSQAKMEARLLEYFPVLPFNKSLTELLDYYQKDKSYTIDSVTGRTDTLPLYVRGVYKNFNPFTFTPSKVLICVREDENWVVYHITALLDTTVASKEKAANEVKYMHKKFRSLAQKINTVKSRKKDPVPLFGYSYYLYHESSWYTGTGWSYVKDPYFTGYFVVVEIAMLKSEIK